MNQCSCLIGNTSSAVREGCFIGVPAVNVGTRQNRRLRGANVMDVPCEAQAIVAAVRQQMEHGKYAPECIYGDGHAGERIAEVLATCQVNVQKTIAY
jgi:UDP-N-acetylglucosamine 2-epimerase